MTYPKQWHAETFPFSPKAIRPIITPEQWERVPAKLNVAETISRHKRAVSC